MSVWYNIDRYYTRAERSEYVSCCKGVRTLARSATCHGYLQTWYDKSAVSMMHQEYMEGDWVGMDQYIAFLRGINVGGKNKISMSELKELFEQNGFRNVVTYINSGNIIFSTDNNDESKLKEECESLIFARFQLEIPVSILSVKELSAAYDHAPSWWGKDKDSKHNAIFIIPPVTVEEVFETVGEIKPEYETVAYYGRVVFWSAPLKTFSRTRWSKIVGSSLYDSITIRNSNTVIKLLELTKS